MFARTLQTNRPDGTLQVDNGPTRPLVFQVPRRSTSPAMAIRERPDPSGPPFIRPKPPLRARGRKRASSKRGSDRKKRGPKGSGRTVRSSSSFKIERMFGACRTHTKFLGSSDPVARCCSHAVAWGMFGACRAARMRLSGSSMGARKAPAWRPAALTRV